MLYARDFREIECCDDLGEFSAVIGRYTRRSEALTGQRIVPKRITSKHSLPENSDGSCHYLRLNCPLK